MPKFCYRFSITVTKSLHRRDKIGRHPGSLLGGTLGRHPGRLLGGA